MWLVILGLSFDGGFYSVAPRVLGEGCGDLRFFAVLMFGFYCGEFGDFAGCLL